MTFRNPALEKEWQDFVHETAIRVCEVDCRTDDLIKALKPRFNDREHLRSFYEACDEALFRAMEFGYRRGLVRNPETREIVQNCVQVVKRCQIPDCLKALFDIPWVNHAREQPQAALLEAYNTGIDEAAMALSHKSQSWAEGIGDVL